MLDGESIDLWLPLMYVYPFLLTLHFQVFLENPSQLQLSLIPSPSVRPFANPHSFA